MKHRAHHKHSKRLKRKFRRLAAAVAGAAIMSSALLPGIPAATAHASASPNAANPPAAPAVSQVVKTPKGFHTTRVMANIKKPQPAAQQQVAKAPTKAVAQRHQATKVTQTKSSPSKAPADFNQVLNVKATAYAPGPHDNGPWGNKTFSGTNIRPGVIAVDPDIIPIGSRVYIEYPDGHGAYAVAEDTGGAIKGNRIDIAMRSVGQANDFGIQNVKLYVLDKEA